YDLELRRYDGQGWRAMFFPSGFEHSLTAHAGSARAPSPWEAVQMAAQDALNKLRAGEPAPRDWTTRRSPDTVAWGRSTKPDDNFRFLSGALLDSYGTNEWRRPRGAAAGRGGGPTRGGCTRPSRSAD